MVIKLDLGGGYKPKSGYISVDQTGFVNVGADLEKQFPFKDDSVDEIWCSHTLEHIFNTMFFMNECWRILMKECRMKITVPRAPHPDAFTCPTHRHFFSPGTFNLFTNGYWCRFYGYNRWGIVQTASRDTENEVYREMIPIKGKMSYELLEQLTIEDIV